MIMTIKNKMTYRWNYLKEIELASLEPLWQRGKEILGVSYLIIAGARAFPKIIFFPHENERQP